MRKLFLSMLAAVALFASCSQEDIMSQTNGESVVSFNVTTPELASRALGDGSSATSLYYAVYDANGDIVSTISNNNGTALTLNDKKAEVKLPLLNGETYSIVFWAEAEGDTDKMATVNWEQKTISVNPKTSNQETYDAFYAYVEPFTVTGDKNENVKLYRPFAQLNIGTTETDLINATQYYFGISETANKYTQSLIKVTVPTTMNLINGVVSDEKEITYSAADFLTDNLKDNYLHLSMNYLLVPQEKSLMDVEFSCYAPNADQNQYITKTFENVPVQRNYKTNIYGTLFTSSTNWQVELLPDFITPENNVITCSVSNENELIEASKTGALITLTNDIELNANLSFNNYVEINGNGYTLSGKPVYFNAPSAIIKNTRFSSPTGHPNNKTSNILIGNGNQIFTVENCEFSNPEWDAIQYISNDAKEISIKNCNFKSNIDCARYIHIQLSEVTSGTLSITGNKFFNADKAASTNKNDMDIVCITGFPKSNMTFENNIVYDITSFQTTTNDASLYILEGLNTSKILSVNDDMFRIGGTSITNNDDASTTTAAITTALSSGIATLSSDVKTNAKITVAANQTLDGAGYTLTTEKTTEQYMLVTTGGTIKNLVMEGYNERNENAQVIRGIYIVNPTESITIDNVYVSGVAYPLNTSIDSNHSMPENATLTVTNSTLIGWTSFTSFTTANFTNCHFGIGTYFGDSYNQTWNGCIKPYITTVFEGCTFETGFVLDLSALASNATITFKNCKVGSTDITSSNINSLLNVNGNGTITVE